jgi:hypothetical protein
MRSTHLSKECHPVCQAGHLICCSSLADCSSPAVPRSVVAAAAADLSATHHPAARLHGNGLHRRISKPTVCSNIRQKTLHMLCAWQLRDRLLHARAVHSPTDSCHTRPSEAESHATAVGKQLSREHSSHVYEMQQLSLLHLHTPAAHLISSTATHNQPSSL